MDTIPDLSSSFEFAACGLVTTDMNGTIRRTNSTFCNWLDFSAHELVEKKKIQDFFTVGGRFFHHTHWAPLLQLQGSVAEILMDLVNKKGERIPMLINAVRQKHGDTHFDHLAFFIATDRKKYERELLTARKNAEISLTSLKQTQKELRESRDLLSIAILSAQMGVWSKDLTTKQVWWSPELLQLTGFSPQSFGSHTDAFQQLIHTDDLFHFTTELEKSISNRIDFSVQFRLKHAAGNWLSMECRGHATYTETGAALSVFGIAIDISERKAAEQKLYELNQQLKIADRRKDEFLATLAHELRNPLAPMRNILEIMRTKEAQDPFLHWSRNILERHVLQMTHLVDDLMEVSRISQGRLELRRQKLDITDLVQHAVETSYALMEKSNHTFTVIKPETPIIIDADSTRIIQIISNLLNNAAKYTPEGGAISLRAFQEGTEVVLSVLDSGIGIPPEQLSNVFGMFSQLTPALERSQGGLGIGLALVQGLVELHGGSIIARSEGEGKGSEFIVRLPIAESAPETSIIPENATVTLMTNKKILIVDDNTDAADSLSMLLELTEHKTRVAYTGTSGISIAEEFLPDAILLDIGLPDINGYEVARRIRQQPWGEKILIVAATGWGQSKDKELAKDAGFNGHLTKPIDIKILTALLNEIGT